MENDGDLRTHNPGPVGRRKGGEGRSRRVVDVDGEGPRTSEVAVAGEQRIFRVLKDRREAREES